MPVSDPGGPIQTPSSSETFDQAVDGGGGPIDGPPTPPGLDNPYVDPSQQILQSEQELGLSPDSPLIGTSQLQQFVTGNEALAGTDILGVNAMQFFSMSSLVDTWAANTGGKFYPSAQQIAAMVSSGVNASNPLSVYAYLNNISGIHSAAAAAGMNQEDYAANVESIQATISDYTGSTSMYNSLASKALGMFGANSGAASAWVRQQLLYNSAYSKNAATPWLQFGMTYNDWQSYKTENKALVTQQFGSKASDTNYVSFKQEGATSRPMEGTAVSLGQSATTTNPLVSLGNKASVR